MPRAGTKLSSEATAKQNEAIKRWHRENTTSICIRVRNEKATAYKELSKRLNKPLARIIQDALDSMIEKDR